MASVRARDIQTGELKQRLEQRTPWIAFWPDGYTLATGDWGFENYEKLYTVTTAWDMQTGALQSTLKWHIPVDNRIA
jgi:hypothetical protein